MVLPLSVFSCAIWAISELMRLSALRASLRSRLVAWLQVQAVDEFSGFHACELFEQSCGFELVAGLEVGELAFDG